jgi:predicted metal-dependent enzyme (double-stranded beta helix superfamily)
MEPWRKSSHSGTQEGDCVELVDLGTTVGIRDSKMPHADHLILPTEGFARLVRHVKQGHLAEPRQGLDDLVHRIRLCTREASEPSTIAKLVAEALVQAEPSASILTEQERAGSPDHYTRHTLHTEDDFSVSAVVWRPGQVTEIHDHLVWCSFLVLQGSESETLFGVEGGRLVEVGRCERVTGSVSGVAPPDDIHQVANTGDSVAITLHVYGADLSQGTSVRRTYELPAGVGVR